ncbi:amino acid ABC transporter [Photobacterium gaetbulicola]|uniref:Putative ABC-type amino acid transport/signal transduction systems n=1 Tax=Photobacterium gaetbulicola Gung47 TaxID=658445 RepID=A0A0C5WK94_9GAMM|nr:transporter substrate-binding domain-containing protein [Photobacterium gaetbulicola]AJR06652.1 putative ABC-type amino acid transport/signal transduction systems [Photobacterium gaetbulicola Gung47]PSU13973.1 amino acid ABC transporter [Photobacterium gaetbulicola]
MNNTNSKPRYLLPLKLAIYSSALLAVVHLSAEQRKLIVAISTDMPPYVMDNGSKGLEVDIVRQALEGYELEFVQMPLTYVQRAVQNQKADIAIGVLVDGGEIYYSDHLVTFVNFAISKKSDSLAINTIDDLKTHPVLTWQNAYLELGDEFKTLFSPGSEYRSNYHEFGNQADQVAQFWKASKQVIVIDRSIFEFFSKAMKQPTDNVEYHSLFPPVTEFKASFKDKAIKDTFNTNLKEMCQNGAYVKLLEVYDVKLETTVCDKIN